MNSINSIVTAEEISQVLNLDSFNRFKRNQNLKQLKSNLLQDVGNNNQYKILDNFIDPTDNLIAGKIEGVFKFTNVRVNPEEISSFEVHGDSVSLIFQNGEIQKFDATGKNLEFQRKINQTVKKFTVVSIEFLVKTKNSDNLQMLPLEITTRSPAPPKISDRNDLLVDYKVYEDLEALVEPEYSDFFTFENLDVELNFSNLLIIAVSLFLILTVLLLFCCHYCRIFYKNKNLKRDAKILHQEASTLTQMLSVKPGFELSNSSSRHETDRFLDKNSEPSTPTYAGPLKLPAQVGMVLRPETLNYQKLHILEEPLENSPTLQNITLQEQIEKLSSTLARTKKLSHKHAGKLVNRHPNLAISTTETTPIVSEETQTTQDLLTSQNNTNSESKSPGGEFLSTHCSPGSYTEPVENPEKSLSSPTAPATATTTATLLQQKTPELKPHNLSTSSSNLYKTPPPVVTDSPILQFAKLDNPSPFEANLVNVQKSLAGYQAQARHFSAARNLLRNSSFRKDGSEGVGSRSPNYQLNLSSNTLPNPLPRKINKNFNECKIKPLKISESELVLE